MKSLFRIWILKHKKIRKVNLMRSDKFINKREVKKAQIIILIVIKFIIFFLHIIMIFKNQIIIINNRKNVNFI